MNISFIISFQKCEKNTSRELIVIIQSRTENPKTGPVDNPKQNKEVEKIFFFKPTKILLKPVFFQIIYCFNTNKHGAKLENSIFYLEKPVFKEYLDDLVQL